jgi:hypothetical protein
MKWTVSEERKVVTQDGIRKTIILVDPPGHHWTTSGDFCMQS